MHQCIQNCPKSLPIRGGDPVPECDVLQFATLRAGGKLSSSHVELRSNRSTTLNGGKRVVCTYRDRQQGMLKALLPTSKRGTHPSLTSDSIRLTQDGLRPRRGFDGFHLKLQRLDAVAQCDKCVALARREYECLLYALSLLKRCTKGVALLCRSGRFCSCQGRQAV